MKDIDNFLTSGKNLNKKNHQRTKSFGYQVLGFGAGGGASPFIGATGGTITTCGSDKIHTFTGPGTFTVCKAAVCAANNLVSYLVVAGGGGAGNNIAGGSGAGGYRELKSPSTPSYTASPLDGYPSAPNRITVTATGYPITVGAGGATSSTPASVTSGANSVFSTITSAGGGKGGIFPYPGPGANAAAGGSGGGEAGAAHGSAGAGNTPPTTPSQGNSGGNGSPNYPQLAAGGGGGAGGTAGGSANCRGGPGGVGAGTAINPAKGTPGPDGALKYYAGGGGGGIYSLGNPNPAYAPGGYGGGGAAWGTGNPVCDPQVDRCGAVNTGGGAGQQSETDCKGGVGGSGVVIIRYKVQ
jgi:hypothetical protein